MRQFLKKFTEGNSRNSWLVNCADVTKIGKTRRVVRGRKSRDALGITTWFFVRECDKSLPSFVKLYLQSLHGFAATEILPKQEIKIMFLILQTVYPDH